MVQKVTRQTKIGNSPKKQKSWVPIRTYAAIVGLVDRERMEVGGCSPAVITFSGAHEMRKRGTAHSRGLFVGQTVRGYEIGHEIPDILDQLFCYCECDKHLGHHTLLSCFVDSHTVT